MALDERSMAFSCSSVPGDERLGLLRLGGEGGALTVLGERQGDPPLAHDLCLEARSLRVLLNCCQPPPRRPTV
jgi:hypothetical protein